ncbi:hypothetical protein FXO37_01781 [Capsicum annuum]|nr:hypothetical protein FXO37_01781 [Capsicum annuum]
MEEKRSPQEEPFEESSNEPPYENYRGTSVVVDEGTIGGAIVGTTHTGATSVTNIGVVSPSKLVPPGSTDGSTRGAIYVGRLTGVNGGGEMGLVEWGSNDIIVAQKRTTTMPFDPHSNKPISPPLTPVSRPASMAPLVDPSVLPGGTNFDGLTAPLLVPGVAPV